MTTHLVVPDNHAHFKHSNERADWLANIIIDTRPDTVIFLGDSADMPSLSGYDRGKKSFQGRTYTADIDSHLEFQDRVWSPVKARKKRMPRRVFLVGNHEQRIVKAIELSPELDGAIGLADLKLDEWYDDVVYYNGGTPGTITIDGIVYAHYFVSGVKGLPIDGEHAGYTLLTKNFQSCTAGHSHKLDYCIRSRNDGRKLMGLVAGCYIDYDSDWAGEQENYWWRGVVLKHDVTDGQYNPQFISMSQMKKEYGLVR
jgi:hypothetical protein